MIAGGVTEIIGYFAGYLHQPAELVSVSVSYDGFTGPVQSLTFDPAQLTSEPAAAVDDLLDEIDRPVVEQAAGDDDQFGGLTPVSPATRNPDHAEHPFSQKPALPDAMPPAGGGGGSVGGGGAGSWGSGGGGEGHFYKLAYQDDGNDKFGGIHQASFLNDDDVLTHDGALPPAINGEELLAIMSALKQLAASAIPDPLTLPSESVPGLLDFIGRHDGGLAGSHLHETADDHAPHSATYIDGALQSQDTQQSWPEVRDQLSPPDHGNGDRGDVTITGSNQLYNFAQLNDLSGSSSTLIVHGNYYQTDAIVQANVLLDQDEIAIPGALPEAIRSGADTTDNIATFARRDMGPGDYVAGSDSDGRSVHVSTVDGDYYNVKWIAQTNVMSDNDVVTQTVSDSYSYVLTGDNEQIKDATFGDRGNYDLIVTHGDFHQANLIYQTNILNDSDTIMSAHPASQSEEGSALEDIVTGDNVVRNQASIVSYGSEDFQTPSQSIQKLSHGFVNDDQMGPSLFTNLRMSDPSHFKVLVVKGNYHDVNVVRQFNQLSDADAVAQLQLADSSGSASTTHSLSTGSNALVNAAQINAVRSAEGPYVTGDHYQDSILIQANMLVSEVKAGLVHDVSSLVPEVAVFATLHDHAQEHHPVAAAFTQQLHHDVLAGMLH